MRESINEVAVQVQVWSVHRAVAIDIRTQDASNAAGLIALEAVPQRVSGVDSPTMRRQHRHTELIDTNVQRQYGFGRSELPDPGFDSRWVFYRHAADYASIDAIVEPLAEYFDTANAAPKLNCQASSGGDIPHDLCIPLLSVPGSVEINDMQIREAQALEPLGNFNRILTVDRLLRIFTLEQPYAASVP
jgi:hypothetical protein